eukprot:3160527-Amphidinium_carterae.1
MFLHDVTVVTYNFPHCEEQPLYNRLEDERSHALCRLLRVIAGRASFVISVRAQRHQAAQRIKLDGGSQDNADAGAHAVDGEGNIPTATIYSILRAAHKDGATEAGSSSFTSSKHRAVACACARLRLPQIQASDHGVSVVEGSVLVFVDGGLITVQ